MTGLYLFCAIALFICNGTALSMRRCVHRLVPACKRHIDTQTNNAHAQALRTRGIEKSYKALIEEPAYIYLATRQQTHRTQKIAAANTVLTTNVDLLKRTVDTLNGYEPVRPAPAAEQFFSEPSQPYHPVLLYDAMRGKISQETWQRAAQCAQQIKPSELRAYQGTVAYNYDAQMAFNKKLVADFYRLDAQRKELTHQKEQRAIQGQLAQAVQKRSSWFSYLRSFIFG